MSRDFSEGKLVVMIGDFVHEGIKAAIEGYDFQFSVRKIMHRTEISIRRAINTIKKASSNNRLAGVIVYLPTPVFLFLCDSCFSQIKYELIDLVRDTNGYVFLYKDNFMGDFNTTVLPDYISFLENSESYSARKASLLANISNYHEPFDHWMGQRYGEIPLESTVDGFYPEIIDFLNYIKTNISNIFSFSSRNEVTLQIIDALNKVSSGEFLKIFISNGKYQAEQVERLIKLLEKYLQSAEKVDFTVNTQHIETGTIIILNSISGAVNLDNLNAQLEKFQDFMNVCQNNPSEAESILIAHGFDRKNANYAVHRYSIEYKRISLDIKQEYEHKILSLKQKLEQEAFEIVNGEYNSVNNLISNQNFIKSLSGISSITINNAESMIINNSETQTILNQALNGDIEYNEFDKALLKKIEEYADSLKKTRTSGKSCRA